MIIAIETLLGQFADKASRWMQ